MKMQKMSAGVRPGLVGVWPWGVRVDMEQELVIVKMQKSLGGWSGWM